MQHEHEPSTSTPTPTPTTTSTSPTISEARRARLALVAAIGLAVVAGWFVLGGVERVRGRPGGAGSSSEVGQVAPLFSLEQASGGAVQLGDLRGKVVLINFWATWCVPCRAEMPEIESAYRAHRGRGFEVLAVNVQESAGQVRPFMAELGLTFPALLDLDAAVSRQYLARALPSSFLIDRQGVVRYIKVGPLTSASLEEQVAKLLE